MRGDEIRKFIWSGVINEPGKVCGAIHVFRGDDKFPLVIQASEAEMFRLARMLRETAREVKRLGGARDGSARD